jgi:hypothetical protein
MFTRVIIFDDGNLDAGKVFDLGKNILLSATLPTNYNTIDRTIVKSFDDAYVRIMNDINEDDPALKVKATIVFHSDKVPPFAVKAFNQRLLDAQQRSRNAGFWENVVVVPVGSNFEAYKNDENNRFFDAYNIKQSRAKAAASLSAIAMYQSDFYAEYQRATNDEQREAIAQRYGLTLAGLGETRGEQGQATYLEDGLPTNPDVLEELDKDFDSAGEKSFPWVTVGLAAAALGAAVWYFNSRKRRF